MIRDSISHMIECHLDALRADLRGGAFPVAPSRACVVDTLQYWQSYCSCPEPEPATSFAAQYLNVPQRKELEPGTYCRYCSHSDALYFDRFVPRRRGEDVPCCSKRDCGCTGHMTETVVVEPDFVQDAGGEF